MYAEAICKLIYKLIKNWDKVVCTDQNIVLKMFENIYNFFNAIPFDNWALADADRRLPLKIIQLLIARIVYYNGDSVMELYTSFLKSISKRR